MKDLTSGNMKKNLKGLIFPFFIGSLVAMVNQLVDTVWVGRLLGADALAAAIVCGVILYVIAPILIGITVGCSILISQYFGAKQYDKIGAVITHSLVLGGAICGLIVFVERIGIKWLLNMIQVPLQIWPLVISYLHVVCLGLIVLYLYYLTMTLFRALGDGIRPIILAAITAGLNAVLVPFFIHQYGISGAPLATIVSNLVACGVGLGYIVRKRLIPFSRSAFQPTPELMGLILKIGIPAIIANMIGSFGVACTQFLVNHYGVNAVAAFGVGGQVDNIVLLFGGSVGSALAIITGQNKGKGNTKRMLIGLREAMILASLVTVVVSILGFIFAKYICMIFISSQSAPEVISYGSSYIRAMCLTYVFLIISQVYVNFFNGVGDTQAGMYLSFLGMWGARIPLAILFSYFFGISGVWYGIAFSYVIGCLLTYVYYYWGRWKKINIIESV